MFSFYLQFVQRADGTYGYEGVNENFYCTVHFLLFVVVCFYGLFRIAPCLPQKTTEQTALNISGNTYLFLLDKINELNQNDCCSQSDCAKADVFNSIIDYFIGINYGSLQKRRDNVDCRFKCMHASFFFIFPFGLKAFKLGVNELLVRRNALLK